MQKAAAHIPHIPRIIGICGYKRSGKDTIAQHVAEKYGYEHVKFAKALKSMIKDLFKLNDDQIEGNDKEVVDPYWKVTPRELMQFIGTEMMQIKLQEILPNVGRSFWVHRLFREYDAEKRLVVSDVRFLHEVDAIRRRDANSLIIRVEGGNCDQYPTDEHISEKEVDYIVPDYIISNKRSIHELLTEVDSILSNLSIHSSVKL